MASPSWASGASTAAAVPAASTVAQPVSVIAGAAPHGGAEEPLTNLRICSYTAFSKGRRCTRDERETVIYSNTIACSVDVTIRPRATLQLRLGYEGQTVYESERTPAAHGRASFGRARPAQRRESGAAVLPGRSSTSRRAPGRTPT